MRVTTQKVRRKIILSAQAFFLPTLLLAALLALPVQAQDSEKKKGEGERATPVNIDRVVLEAVGQTIPVIGRLIAAQSGAVAARTSGPVQEFLAQVGDKVAKDEIIAVLFKDAVRWSYELRKAEVAESIATLDSAKASLTLQHQELKRLENLKTSSAFSPARYDDKLQGVAKAEGDVAKEMAALDSARANLKLAEITLYNTDVRAPYTGVISEKMTSVGAYVNTGQAVVSMVDDEHLEIEAAVPADRAASLEPGTNVRASLGQDRVFAAVVRAVVPEENPLTRTRTARFVPQFGEEAKNLALNQSVTLDLPVGNEEKVLTVHKDAVLNRGGRTVVYVAANGTADLRPVQLGEATGTRFIVRDGLNADDLVIVRGNERLAPGQKITYKGMN